MKFNIITFSLSLSFIVASFWDLEFKVGENEWWWVLELLISPSFCYDVTINEIYFVKHTSQTYNPFWLLI